MGQLIADEWAVVFSVRTVLPMALWDAAAVNIYATRSFQALAEDL